MNNENNNGLENTNLNTQSNTETNISNASSISDAIFGPVTAAPVDTAPVTPAVEPQTPVAEPAPVEHEVVQETVMETAPAIEPVVPTLTVAPEAESFVAASAPQEVVEPAQNMDNTANVPVTPELSVATDNTMVNMKPNSEETPKEEEPKKKKSNALVVIAIIIVLLAALLGGAYFYYTNYLATPYTISKKVVSELFSKSNSALEAFELSSDKTVRLSGNVSLDTNATSLEAFKDLKGSFLFGADPVNNKLEAGLTLTGSDTYSGSLYYINNGLYGKTNLIKDNTLIKVEEYQNLEYKVSDYFDLLNNDDINYINDKLSEYIQKSLNENDFKKRTTEINGKNYTENYIVINNDNYKIMLKSIITSIKNDSKFVEIICDWSNISTDEFNDVIEELVTELDDYELEEDITISNYTYGLLNNYYGTSITEGNNKVLDFVDNKITLYGEDGKVLCTITLNDNGYVLDMSYDEYNVSITVNYTISNNKVDYVIAIKVTNDDKYVTVNVNLTEEIGVTVADVDSNSAVSSNDLTDEDLMQVYSLMFQLSSYMYGDDYSTDTTCESMYDNCVCTDGVCNCTDELGEAIICTE